MLGEALSPHERGQVKRKASGQPSQMEVDEEAAEASEEDLFLVEEANVDYSEDVAG